MREIIPAARNKRPRRQTGARDVRRVSGEDNRPKVEAAPQKIAILGGNHKRPYTPPGKCRFTKLKNKNLMERS